MSKKRARPWPNKANAAREESILQATEIEKILSKAITAIRQRNLDLATALIAQAKNAARIINLELVNAPGDLPNSNGEENGEAEHDEIDKEGGDDAT